MNEDWEKGGVTGLEGMVGEGVLGAEQEPGIGRATGGIPLGHCGGGFPPRGVLQFGVRPAPSPVPGVPGFVACEVLVVAALEISASCEMAVSGVSPSNPPHTPAPSGHRIRRQLALPG